LDLAGATQVSDKIVELVQVNEGVVKKSEVWGRRQLAYPINKLSEATYILHNIQAPPTALKELKFSLGLNEDLVRYMFIRNDKPVVAKEEKASEEAAVSEDVSSADVEAVVSDEASKVSEASEASEASEVEDTSVEVAVVDVLSEAASEPPTDSIQVATNLG
jgi:small subunit ribosomal protein S6